MVQGRNASIDSLRGVAAVLVIIYHAILHRNDTAVSVLTPPIQELGSDYLRFLKVMLTLTNGHNAVLLFFVLSGFVLMLAMDRDLHRGEWSWKSFVVRRFMRLFPVLVAAVAVCFAVGTIALSLGVDTANYVRAAKPSEALGNMALLKTGVIGASWTIQVEVLVVPFLLVGFWMARVFGVAGLAFCLAVSLLELQSPMFTAFSPALTGALFAFYAGMLAAKVMASSAIAMPNGSAIWLMAALYAFVSLFFSLNSTMLLIAQVLACVGLICCVYSAREGIVTRFLTSRQLVRLGRISYSLYLLNVPVMWVLLSTSRMFSFASEWPVMNGIMVGIATTLITIPIADLFERSIEQPANALGKRLTAKSRGPALAPAE